MPYFTTLRNARNGPNRLESGPLNQRAFRDLLQEFQDGLRSRIGLRHSGYRGLLQDLGLGQVGASAATSASRMRDCGGGQVGDLRVRQVDGVLQLVLAGADAGLNLTELGEAVLIEVIAASALPVGCWMRQARLSSGRRWR